MPSKAKDLIDRLHDFKPAELRRAKSSIADRFQSLDEQLTTSWDTGTSSQKLNSELKESYAPTGGIEKLAGRGFRRGQTSRRCIQRDTQIASVVEEFALVARRS